MQHFESFLVRANVGHQVRQQKRDGFVALVNTTGFFAAVALYFTAIDSFWLCVLFFAVWAGVADSILSAHFKRADTKRRKLNPVSEQMADRIAELDDYRAKHSLEDRFHPRVAQRIEACARVYDQIYEGLEAPTWLEKNAGSEWQGVADQARRAAEKAMHSAVAACVGGYRPKGMPRKSWQKKVDEDSEAAAVVQRLSEIEGELVALADALGVTSNAVGSSIASVVARMEEIRRAEEELDGNLHIQA